MSNVIQGNFPQVKRDYGHKKITQRGVESLQSLQRYFLNTYSASPDDIAVLVGTLTDVLENEVHGKYQMTVGHEKI